MEVDEAPIKDDAMPFPGEDVIMTIFGSQPLPEMHHVLDLSTGTSSRYDHGWGTRECKDINFSCTLTDVRKKYICIYIYTFMYTEKIMGRKGRLSVEPANRRLLTQPF
jgi:hypothetical protein